MTFAEKVGTASVIDAGMQLLAGFDRLSSPAALRQIPRMNF